MLEKGLVITTGEVVLQGNVQRPRGTQIDLAYAEIRSDGTKRVTRFPRRLRVLQCTADPFRNTTTFQVGDKLAMAIPIYSGTDVYYTGEHRPSWWSENEFWESGWWWSNYDQKKSRFCKQTIERTYKSPYSDYEWTWTYDRIRKVVPTIEAWPLVKFICGRLDLQLNMDECYKLRFQFLQAGQKFTDGYLSVLDDLIVSEACYGYLDMEERLVIKKYPVEKGATAPVLREESVIDLQTISTADSPDAEVIVNYSARERARIAGKTLKAYTNYERPD